MDKTPKYIKMSIEAKEIQEALKDKFDFRSQVYCVKHKCLLKEDYDGSAECKIYHKWLFSEEELPTDKEFEEHRCLYIGLPYQDQLQDMVAVGWGLQTICTRLEEFSKTVYGGGITINGTMEQLWLAFVMKEKFNKHWKNNKWTK